MEPIKKQTGRVKPASRAPAPLTIAPIRDEDELMELVAPYASWKPRKLPDPRTASVARIGEGLLAIVAAEGPILDHRAFRLYTSAAGLSRASRDILGTYRKAVKREVKASRLEAEPDATGPTPLVLRTAGRPGLRLRERGDRDLDEIPLHEITALIRKLELDRGEAVASKEERFRRLLEVYELKRLTTKARERLDLACARANLPEWSNAITATFEPEGPIPGPRPRRIHRRLRHG